MTNSFIYKIAFISLTIILWTACEQQKVETLLNSNVNSNSKNSERDKKDDELRKAELKKWDKEWIEKLSKDFKVSFLENEQFSNDSLEVRFWYLSSFSTQDSIIVLSRSNNIWTANLIQRNIKMKDLEKIKDFEKETPPAKFIRKKINAPKSGWENLWQNLLNEQVLTLPDGDEVGNEVCPDCETYLVEIKFEGKYRAYNYHAPYSFKEIKEAQQIVEIYDIIYDEFDLEDFKPNKYE